MLCEWMEAEVEGEDVDEEEEDRAGVNDTKWMALNN